MDRFQKVVEHRGLGKLQVIRGTDPRIIEMRARALIENWNAQWAARQSREAERRHYRKEKEESALRKEDERRTRERGEAEAATMTHDATQALAALESILRQGVEAPTKVDWASLRSNAQFSERTPKLEPLESDPPQPLVSYREEPAMIRPWWQKVLELLLPFLKRSRTKRLDLEASRRRTEDEASFLARTTEWNQSQNQRQVRNAQRGERHARATAEWNARKRAFEAAQAASNEAVGNLRRDYLSGQQDAVEQYCGMLLGAASIPEFLATSFEVRYRAEERMLVVKYQLPTMSDLPSLKSAKYVVKDKSISESFLSESARQKLFESVAYQLLLRAAFEVLEGDEAGALDSIAINGHVDAVDPSTGQRPNACVLSLWAKKTDFAAIDLSQVDPKACFRRLKGSGNPHLHSLTPVAPLVEFNLNDSRFVDSRDVAGSVDSSTNLAAMPWEDFEHLIRDLFERVFAQAGATVRVTQASRDGGIDAVIFDPDPIRGGKYVVQAKRYTAVVGVSAVRDLFGTMQHEGAVKGILVTTSYFGGDSREFAKNKPITLLGGAELLDLLGKHGVEAHIDLQAARASWR